MAIISFAKTTDEFLSGNKTETRRDWSDKHFSMWERLWYMSCSHTAYDKSPRAGGKPIGKFRLTQIPFRQQLQEMTDKDLLAEGGMCKTVDEFCKFIDKSPEDWVTVIGFKKI